jgi:hypothetical protein
MAVERAGETGHELLGSASNEDLNDRPSVRDPFGYPDHPRYIEQFARMAFYGCADRHGSP